MKKSTVILALAAFVALPASAQLKAGMQTLKAADVVTSEVMTQTSAVISMKKVGAKAPAKISSVEELYGNYEFKCINASDEAPTTLTPTIVAGTGANEIQIYNMPFIDLALPGVVDLAAGTIKISPVDSGVYNSNYGENQILGPFVWIPGETDKQWNWKALDSLTLEIKADGSIVFPLIDGLPTGISYHVSAGYFMAFYSGNPDGGILLPIKMVEFDMSEWKSAGKADYLDGVLNTLLDANGMETVDAYPVDIMVRNDNPNVYLIVNPYTGSPFAASFSTTGNGYIMIDASDPDCVFVQPLVESDVKYFVTEDTEEPLCLFNMEGLLSRDGYTNQEIIDEYAANDEEVANKVDNVITLRHMRFSFPSSPLSAYGWADANGEGVPMLDGMLTLDLAGVEGVEIDNSNAPVKYYNLQGVEIANPEKGQLVIKRQGTSSEKMIVK